MTTARASIVPLAFAFLATACGDPGADRIGEALSCPPDQAACGQQCIGITADPMNCGGCGIPCAPGQACQGGVCDCVSGRLCNGACVPPETTSGCECPALCPSGQVCSHGTCASPLVTSAPGAYWKTDGTLTEVTDGAADVTVSDSSTAQTWEGFGGAFNEKGWHYLSMLGQEDRDAAIRLLYGADGARLTFGRIPIGASDYAMDRYTLDESAGDTSLASFSIERDLEKLIPFIRAAQAVKGNIRFWASPWTPPTWMKEGPFSPGAAASPFDGGTMKDDDPTLAAFAQYLIKFVQAYAQQGITIEALSPQNEPNYTGHYPTCGWSPATYAKFIGQHLGPAVAQADLVSGLTTKIMLGTLNGGGSDPGIVAGVMGDVLAQGHVDVLGYQWGMQGHVARARPYNLPVWQTEHKCGNYPWATPFNAKEAPNDHAYAVESWGLIRDWIRAGVTAYSAWNLVLDTVGVGIDTTRVWPQNALLTVNTTTKTLNVTPTYHVFRHLSQFVDTGAKVAATRGGDAVAFKNPDGTVVTVLRNAGAARMTTVSAAGKTLRFSMPGNGWATVISHFQ